MRNIRPYLLPTLIIMLGCIASVFADNALVGESLRMNDPTISEFVNNHLPPRPSSPLPPNPKQVDMLRDLLKHGGAGDKERVAWILGDWKGKNNAPLLRRALQSDNRSLQQQAAISLGQLHEKLGGQNRAKTINALRDIIGGSCPPSLLAPSIRSLGLLRASRATPDIAAHLGSDDTNVVAAAAQALGQIGNAKDLKELRKLLDSPSSRVKVAAIESIAQLGKASGARDLMGALQGDSISTRVAAIRAIGQLKALDLKTEIISQLDHSHQAVRRAALKTMWEIDGENAGDIFIDHTKDEAASVRLVAVRAIGEFEITKGVQAVSTTFLDTNKHVRQAAVNSLVNIGNKETRSQAATLLTADYGPARACASQTLGRIKSSKGLQKHLKLLHDEYLPARRWSAWAFGEIGSDAASPDLLSIASEKGQDRQVKAAAILSMGKLNYKKVLPLCHQLLPQKPTMKSPGVATAIRVAAARSMGFLNDQQGASLLAKRLADWNGQIPEVTDVRFESAIALGRINAQNYLPLLKEHMSMEEDDRRVRLACQWSIGEITGTLPELQIPPYKHPSPQYFIRRINSD